MQLASFQLCTNYLSNLLKNKKAKSQPTFVAFIDAEKAFDKVNRSCLFFKLIQTGVTGKVYRIIQNIYKLCQCCVNINGYLTKSFLSILGVCQGDTLSPTLFNIFVNDIVQEISNLGLGIPLNDDNKISMLLYADDIALLAQTEEDLQKMLDTLFVWGEKWGIKFNNKKSQVIHFKKTI